MSNRLIIESDELAADIGDLSLREVGAYTVLLTLRRPLPVIVLVDMLVLLPGETRGWVEWSIRSLQRKGKVTISHGGFIDVAERRYRHHLVPGKVV